MDIDYVVPFVNCADAIWQDAYRASGADDIVEDSTRWRDWDILRFQLRSIEKNMPWLRKIWVVLSIGESQIPEWLNTENEKVEIVYDYEVAPQEVLPTFNSNVVELFFPRIEGLAEHYLTACDDYLINKPLKESDFFDDDKIKLKIEETAFEPTIYGMSVINSTQLVFPDYTVKEGKKCKTYWANHTVTPHIKSENLSFLSEHEQEIIASCSPTRESKNFTWLIYPLNLLKKNMLLPSTVKVFVIRLLEDEDIVNLELNSDAEIIVMNDWYDGREFEVMKEFLKEKMELLFNQPSEFELLK